MTIRQIGKLMRKKFADENICLTPEQFGMLDMISHQDESIQSELAAMMDKDKSAVLRQLDILEENKLIRRLNDSADRRKKILEVTDQGIRMVEKCKSALAEIMENLERNIPREDLETFKSVLIQMKTKGEQLNAQIENQK
jgi:DNA-binding MarR family transcriptional regulator